MHRLLYGFLILMPALVGWLALSAKGKPIAGFGLQLPAQLATDPALGRDFEKIHETIGLIESALIDLHTGAGLFHHYTLRDNALARMLPGLAPRPTTSHRKGVRP